MVGFPMAVVGILVMLTVIRFALKDEFGKIHIDPEIICREREKE